MGAEHAESSQESVLAADSWLVVDGAVRGFAHHLDRFAAAVDRAGGDAAAARATLRSLAAATPATGVWFPRVDFTPAGYGTHVRPAPTRGRRAVLWTSDRDPRCSPTTKGPDLERLGGLREEALERGASEAVVLDDGWVSEGAYSAVLWWRGDAVHVPPASLPRVDSVTLRCLRPLLSQQSIEIVEEAATPADLEGCEVWVLSALHGIRGVSAWIDGPRVAPPRRADAWHERLEALRTPWV